MDILNAEDWINVTFALYRSRFIVKLKRNNFRLSRSDSWSVTEKIAFDSLRVDFCWNDRTTVDRRKIIDTRFYFWAQQRR